MSDLPPPEPRSPAEEQRLANIERHLAEMNQRQERQAFGGLSPGCFLTVLLVLAVIIIGVIVAGARDHSGEIKGCSEIAFKPRANPNELCDPTR